MATSKRPDPKKSPSLDLIDRQLEETDATAGALPENEEKAGEYGRNNAGNPEEGTTIEPPSPRVTGSTLTEGNGSAKTGDAPSPGASPGSAPLDRVRTDASGQRLTTN